MAPGRSRSAARALLSLAVAGPLAAGCGGAGEAGTPDSALLRAGGADPDAKFHLAPIGRFNRPLWVTQAPGDEERLFVVERTGRVVIVRDGRKQQRPFLSLRGRVSLRGERGLLSLAFAPDYERSRRLYVSFTNHRGTLVVREYKRSRRSPDRVDRSTARLVLRIRHPRPTHYGGHLVFGPDRMLYIGTGDGGGPGDPRRTAQDRGDLRGKILRIDPHATRRRRYRVPRSNPFREVKGARDEVWAYGLRNPWRFSFDRASGDLWIGDVGQETFEELNYSRRSRRSGGASPGRRFRGARAMRRSRDLAGRGHNFGWSAFEGNRRFNRRVRARRPRPPLHTYRNGRNGCSITGGFVVRDEELPGLRGRYLYSDFCNGELRSLRVRSGRKTGLRREGVRARAVASFGEALDGTIYLASLAGGVYRLEPR